jgi:hypothetical protein
MAALAAREEVARALGIGAEDVPVLLENKEILADIVAEIRERAAQRIPPTNKDDVCAASHIAKRQRTGGDDVCLDAPLPTAGPRTEARVREAADQSRALSKDARIEERNEVRRVLGTEAAQQQQKAKDKVGADYGGRCQICRRTFITKGGSKDYELVQWQPAVSKGGELVAGNFLLVCGWHSVLIQRAKFTLFGDEPASPERLVERVASTCAEDGLDGRFFAVPISFHQVVDGKQLDTSTVRETIKFSQPHWMSFRLLLGIGEEHE